MTTTPMTLIKEIDYGTPARSGALVSLEIDGTPVTVPAGTSLMRAAMESGVKIPKLCATDNLDAFASAWWRSKAGAAHPPPAPLWSSPA